MFARTRFESALPNEHMPAVPALDIEEILQKRLWREGPLTEQQRGDLKEGARFLDLVLQGRDMAEKSGTQGVASGNLAALKAYSLLSRAYRRHSQAADQEFKETIHDTQKLLREIAEEEGGDVEADDEEVKVACDLFYSLAAMSVDLW
jgi:cytidylate kinase